MSENRSTTKCRPRQRLRPEPAEPSLFEAAWEGAFEAYTAKFVRTNLWRLARTCDSDDAMQEARIVFLRCATKYKGKIDNAAWFMGLYKRALVSRFSDLATKDTHYRAVGSLVHDTEDEEGGLVHHESVGELSNAGELNVALRQASGEVREVLALLLTAPIEILELATSAWRKGGKRAPFENSMINRLLGRDPSYPSLEQVRDHFE